MNVLIYNGEGTSVHSVKQTKAFLNGLLSPYYCVALVTQEQLLNEPWMGCTAMLVIPGGADLPYCKALNGKGNQRIKQYVRRGGRFLGLCAGGYYAAKGIEFEKGTPMEVSGPRELAFYDGVARGTVFKGFVYGSEKGARAAKLLCRGADGKEHATAAYYNGGSYFEGDDADAEVLARYAGPIEMESRDADPAAIVFKHFGEGRVLLSGVHFEYDLDDKALYCSDIPQSVVAQIYEARQTRLELTRFLLGEKLGLKVAAEGQSVPRLTSIYLSAAADTGLVAAMMEKINPLLDETGTLCDKDNDITFLRASDSTIAAPAETPDERPLEVRVFLEGCPSVQETPFFNHKVYYAELDAQLPAQSRERALGTALLYAEVTTSTSSVLERNTELLRQAPHGLVFFATQQTAGRGRGSNVWVNPIGVMAVSGVIRIPQARCVHPLVFIQYLTAMALVRAVNSMLPAGRDIGLRLKWPNDLYIKLGDAPGPAAEKLLAKVGGVMVNCSASNGEYVVVFGSGTNVDNPHPTVSINSRITQLGAGAPLQTEKLLARFLVNLELMVREFVIAGFRPFEKEYRQIWLHENAPVTLEKHGNTRAIVKGISTENGMLVAEDTSGVKYELQPDGNSYDMMRGLIRRKA